MKSCVSLFELRQLQTGSSRSVRVDFETAPLMLSCAANCHEPIRLTRAIQTAGFSSLTSKLNFAPISSSHCPNVNTRHGQQATTEQGDRMLKGGDRYASCCNVNIGQALIEPSRFVEIKHV